MTAKVPASRLAFRVLAALSLITLSATACSPSREARGGAEGQRLVFVPAVEDPFYRAIGAGAAEAAEEAGLQFSVTEYPEAWSTELQGAILKSFDFSDVDVVLVGPVSTVALNDELQRIAAQGVAIITVDTYVGDGEYGDGDDDYALSYVGTDNYSGGKKVAEYLAELVGKEGAVYVNTTHSDVSSVSDRVNGFIAGMAEFPNMHVIATDYNQDRQEIAYTQTLRRLREYPEIRAIFATNLFSSQGAYQAVLESGLTGAVRIASWDSTEPIVDALERGFVDLVLAQSPRRIGEKAVDLAVDHLSGRDVPRRVHVGSRILTLESLESLDVEAVTY
jgi:ribose transport system substrate-binding protein